MLDEIYATQPVADQLKALIRSVRGHIAERRHAMKLLQAFERCSWHGVAFEQAIQQVGSDRFAAVDARTIAYHGDDVLTDSARLLAAYLELACPEELPSDLKQDFNTAEAADYLGLSEAAVRKYVYQTGDLVGRKVGYALVFSREELDAFATRRRKPGRPHKQPQA